MSYEEPLLYEGDYEIDQYAKDAAKTNHVERKIAAEVEPIRTALREGLPERNDLMDSLDGLERRLLLAHHALGLASEAGEVAGKVKKLIRDVPMANHWSYAQDLAVKDEIGDVAWYLTQFTLAFGERMSDVLRRNLDKLADRQRRGVIGGSGDTR